MSSDLERLLRRLKVDKRVTQLNPRDRAELPFLDPGGSRSGKLLYDTTVYVDVLQDRFPRDLQAVLRAWDAWHSTVTESELAALCSLLDPRHPQTPFVVKKISATIERRPLHRILAPDREVWLQAGLMAGLLGRLQQYTGSERRRLFNDALVFATATKYGLVVLTRNIRDFDLLQQIDSRGRVLFY